MRAYLIVTTIVFALITIAHILRAWFEGARVLGESIFVFSTILSIGLTAWGIFLLRVGRPKNDD